MEPANVVSVKLSTLSHATEDKQKVLRAAQEIFPEGFSGKLETARVRGHYGNEIVVFRIKAKSREQADRFFVHFWGRLSDPDRKQIMAGIEEHTDSSGIVYIRIGKQESYRGEILLRELDPIKVEVRFATRGFPGDSMLGKIRSRMITLSSPEPSERP